MEGMQTEKTIAPEYLALVERYKAEPKRSFKHTKTIMNFTWWFRRYKDKLTDDEKEFLQENICRVNDDVPKYNY